MLTYITWNCVKWMIHCDFTGYNSQTFNKCTLHNLYYFVIRPPPLHNKKGRLKKENRKGRTIRELLLSRSSENLLWKGFKGDHFIKYDNIRIPNTVIEAKTSSSSPSVHKLKCFVYFVDVLRSSNMLCIVVITRHRIQCLIIIDFSIAQADDADDRFDVDGDDDKDNASLSGW